MLDVKSVRTRHLLLATVTGIASFVSYARTLYRDWKSGGSPMPGDHKLYCLLGASRSWEFGYREELERIAAEAPWFKFMTTISRPWEDAAWRGETVRVDDLVRKYTDHWGLRSETTSAYLCRHATMCENGQGILTRAGWQKGSMFEERYFIPGKEVAAE
jgi:ferredoxin/flavodoxin---NADP+ reductase